jgi:hypothetical protein
MSHVSAEISKERSRKILNHEQAAPDGAGNTAGRLTRHPSTEDDMCISDHKGALRALEQAIAAERAKLISAHAVQTCLYEVLLYSEAEDAVVYAEAAHVVATLIADAVDKLDSVRLRTMTEEAEASGTLEQDPYP